MLNDESQWLQDVLDQFHEEHHAPLLEAVNVMQRDRTKESVSDVIALLIGACNALGSISSILEHIEGLRDDLAVLAELTDLVASIQDVKEQVDEIMEELKMS
ncbi:hypothetical protein DP897_22765 [Escherichia coli]|nr:hypothetical protein [Escherichia coli]EFO2013714.1 hypothetical protein [Escherichia coli]EHS0471966.1 hypothetical protein [Escherichia coli]